MKQTKAIIWGLAVIALGVIFGGNALGIFDIDIFFKGWWTLFIIVPSVISLFTEKEWINSLAFIGIGVILLLAANDVFSWDVAWKVILAVFLIAMGLSLLCKSIFHSKYDAEVHEKIEKLKKDGKSDSQVAIFSGSERVYNKEEFIGDDIVAVFGGAELDISKAVIKKDVCVKAFCLFGGADIIVPADVQVKSKSGFVFGGISDDRKSKAEKSKNTIYIEAAGGFGGVTIRDSKDKKEKLD
ncbi:hypothetical protein IKG12_03855 [Candidatus Saccharibacteria bacterium]|nr:hypothetical protein [Candidatus Saccharibacteria bacterium]MBR3233957.1 hypothetical protein [Candidatus Saccharibacteria bacterium]